MNALQQADMNALQQADMNASFAGHPPHRLAFVDPKFGILLAEAEGRAGQFPDFGRPSGASTAV